MIRALFNVAGPEAARLLRRNLIGLGAEGLLMGLGFALLVPVLAALFANDTADALIWLAAKAGVLVIYAGVRYRSQLAGYMSANTGAMC